MHMWQNWQNYAFPSSFFFFFFFFFFSSLHPSSSQTTREMIARSCATIVTHPFHGNFDADCFLWLFSLAVGWNTNSMTWYQVCHLFNRS